MVKHNNKIMLAVGAAVVLAVIGEPQDEAQEQ